MADGKQKKITQKITIDVYLKAPGGQPRKSHAGEIKRLQKLGFRETGRKMASREDHVRLDLEREIEQYPGVPLASIYSHIR